MDQEAERMTWDLNMEIVNTVVCMQSGLQVGFRVEEEGEVVKSLETNRLNQSLLPELTRGGRRPGSGW